MGGTPIRVRSSYFVEPFTNILTDNSGKFSKQWFKEMNEVGLREVLEILNGWWREENMPTEMLMARVVLLHKKGDTNKYENYRPISLLLAMSKILEKVVHEQLYKYMTDNKLFNNSQYAFRTNHSTEYAASSLTI